MVKRNWGAHVLWGEGKLRKSRGWATGWCGWPDCHPGPRLGLYSYHSQGMCWCLWLVLPPKAARLPRVWTATCGHVGVQGPFCLCGLANLGGALPPKAMLHSWGLCWCLWPILLLGTLWEALKWTNKSVQWAFASKAVWTKGYPAWYTTWQHHMTHHMGAPSATKMTEEMVERWERWSKVSFSFFCLLFYSN